METSSSLKAILCGMVTMSLSIICCAQFNSGSNGSDGAFNPTGPTNVVNMADHPDGVYNYTSVNIPTNVTVTFVPNANNTPVYWLVQSNVAIIGIVDVSGKAGGYKPGNGGLGGPGGWRGGDGVLGSTTGLGPGGGSSETGPAGTASGSASYGSVSSNPTGVPQMPTYGNVFLMPLLGGSGGAGMCSPNPSLGGGGGGGAFLIVASGTVTVDGTIKAEGGRGAIYLDAFYAGDGSGGAVRIVAQKVAGSGTISLYAYHGGAGRVRFDALEKNFSGSIVAATSLNGIITQGFQPIIFPVSGQGARLTVISVGGVAVSASPTGIPTTPDAVLSAQQSAPMPVVVQCANVPLGTPITVNVKPANGTTVSATGYNTSGTPASSTATVLLNIPRGGGLIYAIAATGN